MVDSLPLTTTRSAEGEQTVDGTHRNYTLQLLVLAPQAYIISLFLYPLPRWPLSSLSTLVLATHHFPAPAEICMHGTSDSRLSVAYRSDRLCCGQINVR